MMSVTWATILVFASVALMAFSVATLVYDWLFRYQCQVRERIAALSPASVAEQGIALFKDLSPRHAHGKARIDLAVRQWLTRLLDEAGVPWTLAMFVGWSAGAGIACGAAGLFQSPLAAIVLGILGLTLPVLFLLSRRRYHRRTLTRQLPEAFAMISRAVRSGQTVPSALQIIADDFDPPVSIEFALCYEQQNLGLSRESALRQLAERSGVMELQIFVVALLVQARSGGDIVELLDNLSSIIRKRLSLRDRIRALSGEGRMQAIVLTLLPIVALIAIMCLAPEYASALMAKPWLLVATGMAQLAGALWIRQIVSVEY
jgi:tight adherence protein B